MLLRRPNDGPLPDPDEPLTGACTACGTAVTVPRWQARLVQERSLTGIGDGMWNDLPQIGCPKCGVAIYLRRGG